MSYTIEDVLVQMHPGQWFGWSDSKNKVYENLVIHGDQEKPTKEFLESEASRLQAEYDSQEYARNRKAEYPTTDELVVALWEAVIEERMASSIDLQGKRTAIKEKYPK
tara:strand:- start:1540 stop:1863 length:324 start_codon:yes stop_codon:yes gene_type:complete